MSNIFTAVSATVVVIGFFIFVILFVIFVANSDSLCITMLILCIFLTMMQIDSVGLWSSSHAV